MKVAFNISVSLFREEKKKKKNIYIYIYMELTRVFTAPAHLNPTHVRHPSNNVTCYYLNLQFSKSVYVGSRVPIFYFCLPVSMLTFN